MKILFFGSDKFSRTVLETFTNYLDRTIPRAITEIDICLSNVIHGKKNKINHFYNYACLKNHSIIPWNVLVDRIKNGYRVSPTKNEHGIDEKFICRNINYDFGVVASFGKMIPEYMINIFKKKMLNVHPSILPQYRGASPLHYALLNGDTHTGVTITEISPKIMDTGRIYYQKETTIPNEYVFNDLRDHMASIGGYALAKVIINFDFYEKYARIQSNKNNGSINLTICKKIKPEQTFINWENDNAITIYNKYRAFVNNYNVKTYFKKNVIILFGIKVEYNCPKSLGNYPGDFTINHERSKIFVRCHNKEIISATNIKFSDRKLINAKEFYTGYIHSFMECHFSSKIP